MKKAVIYYSLTENTKEMAEYVAKELNADLFQIDLKKPMPESMGKQMMIGGMKSTFGMKPKIKGVPENIAEYDQIILGVPIWASKPAAPVNTLIHKYGMEDKIIAVFTCSGGGDNEKCMKVLGKKLKNMKYHVALADRKNKIASENMEKIKGFVKELSEE